MDENNSHVDGILNSVERPEYLNPIFNVGEVLKTVLEQNGAMIKANCTILQMIGTSLIYVKKQFDAQ